MNIFKIYPKKRYESTYEIDFRDHYDKGIRLVLFDVDNTLVEHGAPANKEAINLFKELREIGLQTCVISNNHEERVKSFADAVGADLYIFDAGKPSGKGYDMAMKRLGMRSDQTMMVGDQLFTDMLGANNAGVISILVNPIGSDPYFYIKLKRIAEKLLLLFFI